MYLWSCFFYLLTKIIRDQSFINSVYSHFREHSLLYIRDPERRSFMVDEMRSSYRYMRSFLIVASIDPVHSNDYSEFWQTFSPIIYGDNAPPELGQRKFASIFKSLMRASLREYQASLITPAIQFSISSDGDDTAIPELPN